MDTTMSTSRVIAFAKPAPAVIKDKPIDMLMVYPNPCLDSPFNLTPLSIMYPGKMFEDKGMKVKYLDMRWDTEEMLEDMIKDSAQIGVSCFTGYQAGRAADILEKAKRLNPSIVTNVGGHHARLCPEDVKAEPFVDVVWPERAYHEHSFPFSDECKRLWKRGDMQFITSSGCPYGCTFCALRSAWSPRPLEDIEHQINALHDLTGFTEVSFSDPNIGFDKTRVNGVNEKIDRVERLRGIGRILRRHGIKWDGNIRSDYVTPELTEIMAWSGCFSIEFGCESGNDEFLRKVIRKGHGIDSIKTANTCMSGSGISVMNSFIRGMPREKHEHWLDTMNIIDWIMDVAPEARASVYRFTPYPGGPAYDDAVAGIGIEKFNPPKTMKEWGSMPLMVDPTYWCAGMCFRLDNTQKNFPGEDWKLIEPYVRLARRLWKERRPEDFPGEEVEKLIVWQVRQHNAQSAKVAA
jgi:radical SAM superfamily enzyme YgiQ (UPF0313 family)